MPLLVALVPVALFLALVRRRRPAPAPKAAAPQAATPPAAQPPTDFGLDRDSSEGGPAATTDGADASSGAAAAAAGGALVLGYVAAHRSGRDDSEADKTSGGSDGSPGG